jgi:GNAT superfamily N-acetyltransferase
VSLDYRPISSQDYEQVRRFLSENGWAHRVGNPERFARMMQGTDRAVAAWDEGRVIGFGRALCDGVSNGYLSMVAVAEDRRGQGIGRELVERLMGDDTDITWTLRAGRGSEGFWRRMGFAVSEIAMERTRQK